MTLYGKYGNCVTEGQRWASIDRCVIYRILIEVWHDIIKWYKFLLVSAILKDTSYAWDQNNQLLEILFDNTVNPLSALLTYISF